MLTIASDELAASATANGDASSRLGSGPARTASANDRLLMRYNATGGLDTTFGSGGKIISSAPPHDEIRDLYIGDNHTIVTCGHFTNANGQAASRDA
jgi:hypothetical protein